MRMARLLSWLTPRGAGIVFMVLVLLQVSYLLFPNHQLQEPFHSTYYPRVTETALKFIDDRSRRRQLS